MRGTLDKSMKGTLDKSLTIHVSTKAIFLFIIIVQGLLSGKLENRLL